jgi:hypothetical protein
MWYLMQNRSTIEREGFGFEDHDDLSEARTLRFVPFLELQSASSPFHRRQCRYSSPHHRA